MSRKNKEPPYKERTYEEARASALECLQIYVVCAAEDAYRLKVTKEQLLEQVAAAYDAEVKKRAEKKAAYDRFLGRTPSP